MLAVLEVEEVKDRYEDANSSREMSEEVVCWVA